MKNFWKYVLRVGVILGTIAFFLLVCGTLFAATKSILQYVIRLGGSPGFAIDSLPFFGIAMTSAIISLWMVLKMIASIIVACDVIEKMEVGEDKKDKEVKDKDEKTQNIGIEDVRIEE